MSPQVPEGRRKDPPPGERFDVGGYQLHLFSSGKGRPPVVMEAAIWDFSLTWTLVQPEVAKFTTAVVYDRAGLGWSEPSPKPRTAAVFVDELRTLLAAAGITGPYVLVAQSFSGLPARLFAYQYPDEVAGMVLLDAAHEDQYQRFPKPVQDSFPATKAMQLQFLRQARDAVASQGPDAAPPLLALPQQFSAETAEMYKSLSVADATRFDAMIAELEALEESQAQVRAARSATLGNIPLMVLSHGVAQSVPGMSDEVNRQYEESWQRMQVGLAGQSSVGKRLVVEGSGHMVHHDRPEVVVDAIRQVVAAVREADVGKAP